MPVDPLVIRTEPHREVGSIILRDGTTLIEQWRERAVADQPSAGRQHEQALLDHLPEFLKALAHSLVESREPDTYEHHRPALKHGQQRWEEGWSLPELVRDYQILRLVILDHLEAALDRPLHAREAMAIGLNLDEAIATSVTTFYTQRSEQLRRLEEGLREADRRKNEFLATLAHELRNPLAPLWTGAELLAHHPTEDALVVKVRDIFERQLRLLTRLVDDLLDVSRIAQGKIHLKRERIDLRTVIQQAVQTCEPVLTERKHRLEVDLPDTPLWVEADTARLVQVVVNLVNNAAKYTDPGGLVRASAAREDDSAVVRISDNGVGISQEMLPRIFDLFSQAEWAPTQSRGGLGIGLSLVRRLVELHGGTVSAASQGPGKGSEFTVRLSLRHEDLAAERTDLPAPGTEAARRVLIVEGHSDSRESLAILLRFFGHTIETVGDGAAGIAKALDWRPDTVVVALGLPDMDGCQVANRVRAALGPTVLLVALTGYGAEDDRRRTREAGFDHHLVKPTDPEELRKLLTEAHPNGKAP